MMAMNINGSKSIGIINTPSFSHAFSGNLIIQAPFQRDPR